ncbi:MAG: DUF5989 family protein [Halopseudomonas sp.]
MGARMNVQPNNPRSKGVPASTATPSKMFELVRELWSFIVHGKRYWMLPILFILLLLGGLIVATEGSTLLPFIYALF